jgi:hypothetical protein
MQAEDKHVAELRMTDINETLEKLIALAKKRKYISADSTMDSLRLEAEKKVQESAAKATIAKMTQMKHRLDTQTAAVRFCLCHLPVMVTTNARKRVRPDVMCTVVIEELCASQPMSSH